MAGILPPIFVELKANASEFHAEMGKARAEVAKLQTEGSAHLQKFAAVGKAALMGLATIAVTVGTEAIHMADKFELSHVRLENAIKNTGSSFDAYSEKIGAADKKLEGLGFTNAQTEQALGTLVAGTGSTKKALAEMATAADLARFKNLDLNDAAFMLTRALQGNSRVLKQLGIDLPTTVASASQLKKMQEAVTVETERYNLALEKFHGKRKTTQADLDALRIAHDHLVFSTKQLSEAQHSASTIQDAITAKIGGTAVAASETFAGKLSVLRARTEDLGKNIGLWLIPKIEAMVSMTMTTVTWMEHHKAIAETLGIVIGTGLTLAISAYIIKLGQSVVATTAGVGRQVLAWAGFKTSVIADNAAIATSSSATATKVQAAYAAAATASAGEMDTFAAQAKIAQAGVAAAAEEDAAAVSFAWRAALSSITLVGSAAMLANSMAGPNLSSAMLKSAVQADAAKSISAAIKSGQLTAATLTTQLQKFGLTPDQVPGAGLMLASAHGSGGGRGGDNVRGLGNATVPSKVSAAAVVAAATGGGGIAPVPTGTWDNTPGPKGPKGPTPLTAAQIAALKFSTHMTNLESTISSQSNLSPGSVAMAKAYEKAESATLREAEANKKHAAALVKAAQGAKAKHAATLVLARAQRDVNTATKNLLGIKAQEKNLLLEQAQAAADLANAKIEAGVNFTDAIAVARARVQEAQNTLGADQPDSLKWYQDKAALNQAQVDLLNALQQNTTATVANTVALAPPINALPNYTALRTAANRGAYVGSGMSVNVQAMSGQQILTAINAELRRNGRPALT